MHSVNRTWATSGPEDAGQDFKVKAASWASHVGCQCCTSRTTLTPMLTKRFVSRLLTMLYPSPICRFLYTVGPAGPLPPGFAGYPVAVGPYPAVQPLKFSSRASVVISLQGQHRAL